MTIVCPACKKENTGDMVCSRCGCDITPLAEIISAAENVLNHGIAALKRKEGKTALACAKRSWALKNSIQAAQLGFFASLMINDSVERTRVWHRRIKPNSQQFSSAL